jgi:hypothetical protein
MVVQKTLRAPTKEAAASIAPIIIECWPQKIGEALIKINA